MKISVTGSRGFLGRNVVEGLQSQYEVIAPTHKELDLTNKDAVAKFFDENDIDVVVHCASAGDSPGDIEEEAKMFVNVALQYNCKMIHIGSGAEYGKQRPIVNITEDKFGLVEPDSIYGKAKYAISKVLSECPLPNVITLRPFGIFGKYENPERRFISNAILKSLKGEPIVIYKNVKFSYLPVEDFVRIIKYLIDNDPVYRVYNIAGHTTDLKQIAHMVNEMRKRVPVKVLQKGMGNEYTGDDSRLRKELKIKYTPLRKSIKKLLKYYERTTV